jgi:16S rRNA (guanine1207-N2)-methyltransferase
VPGTYDAIVMNPPFHRGQDTRVDVGRAFIHAAARALRRGGGLYLVANRQLPYEGVLDSLGLAWRHAGGDPGYKLIFARKP